MPSYTLAPPQAFIRSEIGIGPGWAFADDLCMLDGRLELCDERSYFWNLQGIIGLSGSITEPSEWTLRYRTQHIGSLANAERMRVFTFGVRFEL